jgi:hypothetical protein
MRGCNGHWVVTTVPRVDCAAAQTVRIDGPERVLDTIDHA